MQAPAPPCGPAGRNRAGPVWLCCGLHHCAGLQAVIFAIALIAAKPVKPCDGGVFWAFDLLLKKERKALVPVSGRAGVPFAAQARTGLRACLKSGSSCKRPFPLLPQQPAPLQGIAFLLLL